MISFTPPPFHPSRLYRGGTLQTIASLRRPSVQAPQSIKHTVELPDGDCIVLHQSGRDDGRALLIFHGLSGCHQSPYMIRLTRRFHQAGWTVYRVDGRGCGAARDLAHGISHAGRSEDVRAAFDFVASRQSIAGRSLTGQAMTNQSASCQTVDPAEPQMDAIAVSLGGNQMLRMLGRIGKGLDPTPNWIDRIGRVAAVCPPIDLARCCQNMQRRSRRFYNRYFIRALLKRLPERVRSRSEFQQAIRVRTPRTLYELDDRLTAPLSGFAGADDYYRQCGAVGVLDGIRWPTLVLAAADDPIVPHECFIADRFFGSTWPESARLIVTPTGGHAGFIDRSGRCWMDECLFDWIASPQASNCEIDSPTL
ncbi:alpha/beta fold hydrolase [Roseiconus lacunae]|uniref:YheT family hydrolase n=1 Tax=Roseiconus lacunae TaxID=2605694 RepID=UPI003092844F|nr:alpha/beta fold hydrolase [Stieleria sp. HD01]